MGIIQDYNSGKTELNKLKYKSTMGSNHPGEPPLITRKIPTEPATRPSPEPLSSVRRRSQDVARLTQLFSRSEGIGFLSNNTQLGLAVDNSYTVKGSIKDKISSLKAGTIAEAVKNTTGTLGSTLAQVAVAGTGTHFIKGKVFGRPEYTFNEPTKAIKSFGQPGLNIVRYDKDRNYLKETTLDSSIDSVTNKDAYKGANSDSNEDLVKFLFQIIEPGEKQSTFLHFRAYIDNLSDSYSGAWNETQYIGRGEKFYSYGGFNRTINLAFKSAVTSKKELKPLYKKLVLLASTTAPSYSDNNLMRGTFVKLTLGDYLSATPGIITSVNYTWNPKYPFEIQNNPDGDSDLQQLPHVLDCTIDFTPLHEFTPTTGLNHFITNPTNRNNQFFKPGEEV